MKIAPCVSSWVRLAPPLLLLTSCSMIGHLSQRSVEAAGVVGTSAVATPLVGFASWPLWNYLGSYAGTWVSGTKEVRVEADSGPGNAPGGHQSHPYLGGGNFMLWLILAVAFVALGGPAWVSRRLDQVKRDRDAHKARTAALEKENARLREEVDELWDRVTGSGPQPPSP